MSRLHCTYLAYIQDGMLRSISHLCIRLCMVNMFHLHYIFLSGKQDYMFFHSLCHNSHLDMVMVQVDHISHLCIHFYMASMSHLYYICLPGIQDYMSIHSLCHNSHLDMVMVHIDHISHLCIQLYMVNMSCLHYT